MLRVAEQVALGPQGEAKMQECLMMELQASLEYLKLHIIMEP